MTPHGFLSKSWVMKNGEEFQVFSKIIIIMLSNQSLTKFLPVLCVGDFNYFLVFIVARSYDKYCWRDKYWHNT